MKTLYRPYLKSLVLLLLAPYVAARHIREHWKMYATATGCAAALMAFLCMFGYCNADGAKETPAHASKAANISDDGEFVDLSAAFSNGEKRQRKTEMIVIHHTAGNPDAPINSIVVKHFTDNRWHSIGYHVYIGKDGTTYQLRDLDEVGNHAYGYVNARSVAVCLGGNFSITDVPQSQWEAALRVVRCLMQFYGLPKSAVMAHHECDQYDPKNATACCGSKFNIEKFRNEL